MVPHSTAYCVTVQPQGCGREGGGEGGMWEGGARMWGGYTRECLFTVTVGIENDTNKMCTAQQDNKDSTRQQGCNRTRTKQDNKDLTQQGLNRTRNDKDSMITRTQVVQSK